MILALAIIDNARVVIYATIWSVPTIVIYDHKIFTVQAIGRLNDKALFNRKCS